MRLLGSARARHGLRRTILHFLGTVSFMFIVTAKQLKELERVDEPQRYAHDSEHLRIVAFSDYRVQDIPLLLEWLKGLSPAPDLLLYAGDDVERFQNGSRNFFEQLAATAAYGLCAVIGNDSPICCEDAHGRIRLLEEVAATRRYIRGKGVRNVHRSPLILGKYAVIGSEGSPPDKWGAIGNIIYPEPSIARHLRLAAKAAKGKHIIVVSHTPPRLALDSAIRFGRRRIGSVALREFIRRRRDVSLVVCGHVHSCGGRAHKTGRCIVVNAASHDDPGAPGRVALIEIKAGKVLSVAWHLLWELASIPGIGAIREGRLRDAGLCNLHQFAEASAHNIDKILKVGHSEAARLQARAASFLKQDVIHRSKLQIPAANRAYLDVETHIRGEFIWLVGLHVEDENKTYSFYAETPKGEKKILSDTLELLNARPDLNLLSYSNCKIEQRMLSQRLAAHGLPTAAIQRIKDIYGDIHACAAFPVQGLNLKNIAEWCGFKYRDAGIDGFSVALLYGASGRLPKSKRQMVIRYNEDDLLALKCIVRYLEKLGEDVPFVLSVTGTEDQGRRSGAGIEFRLT